MKMKKIKKSRAAAGDDDDDDAFRFFSRLPDDVVIEVLNKITDLKTLCICKPVSKRFYRNVLQVEVISHVSITHHKKRVRSLIKSVVLLLPHFLRRKVFTFNKPSVDPLVVLLESDYIAPSLNNFQRVKSLSIQLPLDMVFDDTYLFKWKVIFPNSFGSFIFLSPNSVQETKGVSHANEYDHQVTEKKLDIAINCLMDASKMQTTLMTLIENFSLLEKVSITDPHKRGLVSVSGGRAADIRNWIKSLPDDTLSDKRTSLYHCYVPSLELPDSGYKMNGVTLYLFERDDLLHEDYSFMKSNFKQDKEEAAAYTEAMMLILSKHRNMMQRIDNVE